MNPAFEKQLGSALRAVEDARRNAHRDPAKLGELVEYINVLAELRQQEGAFPKAESLYKEVLYRIQEMRKPDAELLTGVYTLLAHLYDRWGRLKDASEYYQKALDCASKNGLIDSAPIAVVKNNLAMIQKGLKDYPRAEQYYEEALEIFRRINGENSPEAASVYNNLGVLRYQNLDLDGALAMHIKALTIRENLDPTLSSQDDLAQSYINLGATYKALGDFQKAQQCVEHARTLAATRSDELPPRRSFAALILDKSS